MARAFTCLLLLTLGLASEAQARASALSGARADAVLYGRVELCGGPRRTPCFGEQMTVALWAGGRRVGAERTRTGRFHLRVPAGRYELLATTSGAGGLHRSWAVTARAHRAVHLLLIVPIR